jgi:S1-C subfamily serine protease
MPLGLLSLTLLFPQEPLAPESLYKKVLPSVATLLVEQTDGSRSSGTAFLARKEGCAVTALHVLKNAKRVVAKFSDGEEYDVSGWIDSDPKRDVALIRIKVVDRPLLEFAGADPEIGSKAYVIGAPQGLEFSLSDGLVSQVRTLEGQKQFQFTCPASPGNSGGPLVDSKGAVLGVVSWQRTNGQNLNFAVAGSYARALDDSLPTKSWTEGVPSSTLLSNPVASAKVKKAADALEALHRLAVYIQHETEWVMADTERHMISSHFREEILGLAKQADAINATVEDPGDWDGQLIEILKYALFTCSALDKNIFFDEDVARFVAVYRSTEIPAGFKEALDKPENATLKAAISTRIYTKLFASPYQKGWKPHQTGRVSRKRFVPGLSLLARLALDVDSTGYVFGLLVDADNPRRIFATHGGFPGKGLNAIREGDEVVSVEGEPVASIEEMKSKLIALAKPTKVIFRRKGKETTLTLDVRSYLDK